MRKMEFDIADFAMLSRGLSIKQELFLRRAIDLYCYSEKNLTTDRAKLIKHMGIDLTDHEIEDAMERYFEKVGESWYSAHLTYQINNENLE